MTTHADKTDEELIWDLVNAWIEPWRHSDESIYVQRSKAQAPVLERVQPISIRKVCRKAPDWMKKNGKALLRNDLTQMLTAAGYRVAP